MSLTVTVQKGHDFSSGNVTRAALNNGATPTVAVTGSVGSTEIADQAITNAKVSNTAAIVLSKLAAQSANNILLVDDSGNITSAPKGTAAIELDSGNAKVTPSDAVITAAKLAETDDTNIVSGLTEDASYVAADDDYVIVHDTSASTGTRLKKAKINKINKVGTTEYSTSNISLGGSDPNYLVAVDLDGAPFQTVSVTGSKNHAFSVTNMPSSTVKTVTVRVVGDTGSAANLTFTSGWKWPERSGGAPSSIAAGEVALLSLTAFGNNATDVIAAYAVTQ